MSQDDCIFCKMVAGQIPAARIYEDDVVLAFLDIGPLSDGHTLVIPKQHFDKVDSCPDDVMGQVARRLGRVARAVVAGTSADGYNVLCNNGRVAGQLVGHLHFHIIPRSSGDGLLSSWPAGKYATGQIDAMAAKIRDNL